MKLRETRFGLDPVPFPLRAAVPDAVSPGAPDRMLRVADQRPTFSWGATGVVERYELLVGAAPLSAPTASAAIRGVHPGTSGESYGGLGTSALSVSFP